MLVQKLHAGTGATTSPCTRGNGNDVETTAIDGAGAGAGANCVSCDLRAGG